MLDFLDFYLYYLIPVIVSEPFLYIILLSVLIALVALVVNLIKGRYI